MIETMIKVFMLEDLKTDQELIKRQVLKIAPNAAFTIASSKEEFLEKIEWATPDIILADYNIPGFGGLEALFYAKEHIPYVPFVFVSATLNDEEKVAESIIKGASGYILKQNLRSFPDKIMPIIQRSQEQSDQRAVRKEEVATAKIKLQKLQALIERIDDNGHREQLSDLVQDIQTLLLPDQSS